MAHPPAGSRGLSDDLRARARAWAERSCLDQDVPLHVADRQVLSAVADLLKAGRAGGDGQVLDREWPPRQAA